MSKEKIASLTKYADGIRNRIASPTPEKHKENPQTYKQFLDRELDMVNKNIETLKEIAKK